LEAVRFGRSALQSRGDENFTFTPRRRSRLISERVARQRLRAIAGLLHVQGRRWDGAKLPVARAVTRVND
jgi:hypothetical protein